jgi:hypothetical protein
MSAYLDVLKIEAELRPGPLKVGVAASPCPSCRARAEVEAKRG